MNHKDSLRSSTISLFYPFSSCQKLLDLHFRLRCRQQEIRQNAGSFLEGEAGVLTVILSQDSPIMDTRKWGFASPWRRITKLHFGNKIMLFWAIQHFPGWSPFSTISFCSPTVLSALAHSPTNMPPAFSLSLAPSFGCSVYFFHILTLFQFQAK